ncbi:MULTISPECIES: hypothetical protein [unclassified Bradyrhizobium]|uniref:hypothetical protein n=1 Tax=unclassified Bradyrhizobium TaxID=2631580 RepID=UPI0015CBD68D|nr:MULTISPECIES: hypothetical protein [unclassified Bradyrhizobium]MBB4259706.1 hypothetical protein [Bradyrhizobium sp. CIR3A]NYG47594.1 hypothetical protein [Bradyrhizobium sp. IAR9]
MVTKEELSELVWSKPLAEVAEELGESRGSVISMCNIYGVARPKQSYWAKSPDGKTPRKVRLRPPHTHRLIRDAKEHFEHCRPLNSDGIVGLFKSSYLKPYKKLLVDITTSKGTLDKALRFANDLFSTLESAGHRVTLARRGENLRRAAIDERETRWKRPRSYFDSLWSPMAPTVVYIGSVAIGLAVVEMSEEVLLRYVGGKYVRDSDCAMSAYLVDRTRTTTQDAPSGRLRLLTYSPYYRVEWSTTWQDTKDSSIQSSLKQIVKSLEGAASEIAIKLKEEDRKAEIARLERLAAEERYNREEDKRRAQQSIKDSQEHLGQIIQQWSNVMNVERFLAGAAERATTLPEAERNTMLERLNLARQFLGTQDPLDFLRSWKTPDERYQPLFPLTD